MTYKADWATTMLCALFEVFDLNEYGMSEDSKVYGVETVDFTIMPYYWGDDPSIIDKPNFYDKQTGLAITWYKYLGRSMESNRDKPQDWSKRMSELISKYSKGNEL